MHVSDIDVMIDVYIYILSVTMECKKKLQFSRYLPSAMDKALGKVFSKKNPEILCRVPGLGHSAKYFFKKNKKNLPSALIGALGKVIFKKIIKKLCRVPRLGHSAK